MIQPPPDHFHTMKLLKLCSLLLLAGLVPRAAAQQSDKNETRKAAPAAKATEVRKADTLPGSTPMGGEDKAVLAKTDTMTTGQLVELLQVYLRKKNAVMSDALVGLILKRDPKNPDLPRLLAEAKPDPVEADVSDDPEADEAERLARAGQPAKAAAILEKLKRGKYKGQPFPYEDDLAGVLEDSGRTAEAEAAYNNVIASPSATAEEKRNAKVHLAEIALDRIEKTGHAALRRGDYRQALATADYLLKQAPGDPEVRLLRADALMKLGRVTEAERELASVAGNTGADINARLSARRELNEMETDRLLLFGAQTLRFSNRAKALQISEELLAISPRDPDVLAFRADVLSLNGRLPEAVQLLEDLKARSNDKGIAHFEPQPELAAAYEGAGQYAKAESAYREVVADPAFTWQDHRDALNEAEMLHDRIRPGFDVATMMTDESEGQIWTTEVSVQTPLFANGSQFFLKGTWDHVALSGESAATGGDEDLFQSEVTLRQLVNGGFYVEGGAGVSQGDALFHFGIGEYARDNHLGWDLRYDWHARATDSLSLRALDGRENKLSLTVSGEIGPKWQLDATLFWREVEIDGTKLGDGYGASVLLNRIVIEETRTRPELAIGYFGQYERFNGRTGIPQELASGFGREAGLRTVDFLHALIQPEFNRHSIQLTFSKQLNDRLSIYGVAGLGYDFIEKSAVYRIGGGLAYRISRNASFNLGLEYESSGRAGNSGTGVTTGTAGISIRF